MQKFSNLKSAPTRFNRLVVVVAVVVGILIDVVPVVVGDDDFLLLK